MIAAYSAEIKFLDQQGENILLRLIPDEEDVQKMLIGLYSTIPVTLSSYSGEQLSFVNQKACNKAFRIFDELFGQKSNQSDLLRSLLSDSETGDKKMANMKDWLEKVDSSECDSD